MPEILPLIGATVKPSQFGETAENDSPKSRPVRNVLATVHHLRGIGDPESPDLCHGQESGRPGPSPGGFTLSAI